MYFAQTVSDAISGIEVQIITVGGGAVVTALAAVLAYGVLLLKKKLSLDDKNQATAAVEATFQNGLSKGLDALAARIARGVPIQPQDHSLAVAEVAQSYVTPKIQDELKRAGIDPDTVFDRLQARAAGKLLEPAITDKLNAASLTAAKRAAP